MPIRTRILQLTCLLAVSIFPAGAAERVLYILHNIDGFALTPAKTAGNTLGDQWCFFTE